jgi:hypothetical protein
MLSIYRLSCAKNFGSQIGQCSPPLVIKKAENVDQSDSSIPFAAAREDTPAIVKDAPHLYLTLHPQAAIFSSRYS